MYSDPLADMFARIMNGWRVKKKAIVIPYSRVKLEILKKFEEKGLVKNIKEGIGTGGFKELQIELGYTEDQEAVIDAIKRVSKPGRRLYAGWQDLKRVRQGFGFRVISTSRGVLFDHEARKRKLGGEIICEIT